MVIDILYIVCVVPVHESNYEPIVCQFVDVVLLSFLAEGDCNQWNGVFWSCILLRAGCVDLLPEFR